MAEPNPSRSDAIAAILRDERRLVSRMLRYHLGRRWFRTGGAAAYNHRRGIRACIARLRLVRVAMGETNG